MANPDVKYGLRFYKNLYGPGPAQTIECEAISGTAAIFVGMPVELADVGGEDGRPGVIVATAGGAVIFGVVQSVMQVDGTLRTHGGATGARRIVQVIPALEGYMFTVNPAAGVNLQDIGQQFNMVVGTGVTATGQSDGELGDTTGGTAAGWSLQGFVDRPGFDITNLPVSGDTADITGIECIVTPHETRWVKGAGLSA